MPYKDIEKRRECRRRWYKNNKELEKAYTRKHKDKIKKWYLEYKKTLKCKLCQERHPACLEFHHKDPTTKERDISRMARDNFSIKKMKEEIVKCQVLCCNCHRKLHSPVV